MHDIINLTVIPLFSLSGFSLITPKYLSQDEIGPFTVGLIDGDGSLQVNQWRQKSLQYRLIVKLRYRPYNLEMLTKIGAIYGGKVKVVTLKSGSQYVQWVVNDSHIIRTVIVPLMTKYPPLTSRMIMQLNFVIKGLNGMTIEEYFATINQKYDQRSNLVHSVSSNNYPSYFGRWLAGFIEAEGSFSIRNSKNVITFSIGQLNDLYLIEAIRNFYGQNHLKISVKVQKSGNTFYELSIGSLAGILSVIKHCQPLLQGYKYVQLAKFVSKVNALESIRELFWFKIK